MTFVKVRYCSKRTILLFLFLLLNLALSACGDTKPTTSPTLATTQANSATTSAGNSASSAKTKLVFWTQNRHDETYMREQLDLFNKTNTDNIEVEYIVHSEEYSDKMELAWRSGNSPDLFTGNTLDIPRLAKAGFLEPLDAYLNEESKNILGKTGYIDNYNVVDGKLYCLINYGTTFRLIYNKDLFQKAGLSQPPKTAAQLVEYAKKLTEAGKAVGAYGFSINLKTPNNAWKRSLYSMAQRSGLYYYDYKTGQFDFNGYLPYLDVFSQMVKDGSLPPNYQTLDIDGVRKSFAQGKVGMYLSLSAEPSVYAGQFPTTVDWAAAPQPTLQETPGGVAPLQAVYWAGISAQSKNKQAAGKVLNWIFRKEFLTTYQEKGYGASILSAISKTAPAPSLKNYSYFLPDATDAIWPVIPTLLKIEGKDMDTVMADIVYGIEADPVQALKDLTIRYNKALNEGISKGTYQKIVLPAFNPLDLQNK